MISRFSFQSSQQVFFFWRTEENESGVKLRPAAPPAAPDQLTVNLSADCSDGHAQRSAPADGANSVYLRRGRSERQSGTLLRWAFAEIDIKNIKWSCTAWVIIIDILDNKWLTLSGI